jgi:putative ABC transport system permease protein
MSYIVKQRTRDIGIRMALGARSQDVVREAMQGAARLVLAGIALGLPGALAAARALTTSLYEVQPTDLQTYITISIALIGVAMFASYFPTRKASAVDPSITLRAE